MRRALVTILLLLPLFPLQSQLAKQWEFTLEGNGLHPLSYDLGNSCILKTFPTPDGDFITISQQDNSYIKSMILVYRFTPSGEISWEYEYESAYGINEQVYEAMIDPHGDIYIAASTTTQDDSGFEEQIRANALVLKLSPEGELRWSYESPPPFQDYYVKQACLDIVSDGEGNTYSALNLFDSLANKKITIHKRDPQGELIWKTTIPYSYKTYLHVIDTTLIAIKPGTGSRIFHINTISGNILYSDTIPLFTYREPIFDAQGNWYDLSTTCKYKVNKRSIWGDILWSYYATTNLPSNHCADEAIDATLTSNGNLLVTGRHYGPFPDDTSQFTNCDILTTELDRDGNLIWEHKYQFNDRRSCQIGERILEHKDEFVFVAGYQSVRDGIDPYASSDMLILVYSPEGELIDSVYYNSPADKEDNGVNMILEEDALYLLGWTQQQDLLYDQTVIKYKNHFTVFTYQPNDSAIRVYPNPVNHGTITISGIEQLYAFQLYDLTGRVIVESNNVHASTSISLPADIPAGCYYLRAWWGSTNSCVPLIVVNK